MIKSKTHGFTLIEMMVVVALIGVLSAVAIPSYSAQIQKSNRSDAQIALTTISQRMERCYTAIGTYKPTEKNMCSVVDQVLDSGIASEKGFYVVKLAASDHSKSRYVLRATAVSAGRQSNDKECSELSIDNIGSKKAQDSNKNNTSDICW